MKKALSFVIASILAASLTGCGSGSPAATTAAPAATTAAAETTAAAAPAETQAAEKPAEKPAPTGKTIEIKMVTTNGSSDPSVAVFQECAEEIKEKTNGEIDIQVYPDGQILTGDEGIEALKSGASVIVVNDCNTLGDYVPVFNTLCAPYMFTSSDEIQAFVKTDTFQDVVKVGDDAGFHLICANYNFGARSIIADGVEVRSIDDVAPLKLGIPSVAAYVNIFKEFGVNYTTGSWGDRVSGIETKQLNGCEGTAQRVSSSKVYDLMEKPVYSDIRYFVVPCAMQVSYDFWKTIPEQYQTIITDVLTAGGVKASGIARDAEADYMKSMTDDGVLIIENKDIDLSGFQAAADRVNADLPMYAEIKAAVQEAVAAAPAEAAEEKKDEAPAADGDAGDIAAVPAATIGATGKTYEIKMVTTNGSSDPSVAVFQECAEQIKEKTNGEIDIQVYPDGQILTGDEGIEALKSGASVIVVNDCNTLGDYVPVFNTLCAPYMFTSSDEIQAFVKTDTFQDVVKVGDDAGFHLICANYNFGARSIIADGVEVRSIDDVAPLKLGIPSVAAYVNIFKEFGVNYTTGSWGDRVSGIETKQLNGCEGTAQRVSSSKVYDLMEKPVYSDIRYFVVPCAMQVSYDFWKTLPAEYCEVITNVLTAGGVKASGIARDAEADYMKSMTDDGVLIIENKDIDLSGFQAAADRVNADLPMYAEIKAAVQEANK